MNKTIIFFSAVLFIFSLFSIVSVNGQGCSDAGACSIGSLDETSNTNEAAKFKLSYDQNFGLGEKFTFISRSSLIVEHRFIKSTRPL